MKVSEIMTKEVISLSVDDTVQHAAELMKQYNIGSIPVNAEDRGIIGIVTDRDIILRCAAEGMDIKTQTVRGIMTSNPVACDENIDVNDAVRIMSERQIRRLPITQSDKLVGMVSLGDLVLEPNLREETIDALGEISIPSQRSI
ncbi:MAG: CBS domain-containing protein [Clostridium sp.]|uniref:CBS domain-containing protein n=1 Tax=Clostridium sp. TaxID=1506 RepID=UPI003D6C9CB0